MYTLTPKYLPEAIDTGTSSEHYTSEISSNTNGCFIKIPLCFQETDYTCGAACVQSILAGFGIVCRQDALTKILKTKPIYGTDHQNILDYMEKHGFHTNLYIEMTIDRLKELISKGITPILMLQAWKEDNIDYRYDWRDGHYTVACGYNDEYIFFMDPFTLGNYTYIPYAELMKRWHIADAKGYHYFNSALIITNSELPFQYNEELIKHQD